MRNKFLSFVAIAATILTTSCNKDEDSSTQSYPLAVRMTDAPAAYDEVNIDLQGVEVTGDNGQVVFLNTTAGIYNLLDLSNGVSALIATSTLTDAKISQIRLILGTDNTIVVDGVSYPLSTPSADQSGLKLQVHQTLIADIQNQILLDFDANQSIVLTGSGTYKLKPVVRTIVTEISGNIAGSVSVLGVAVSATATSTTGVQYSSSINNVGQFQITGLPPGTYTLTITPELPYLEVVQTDVIVEVGATTQVGTIILL
jgi:hypothetical protein